MEGGSSAVGGHVLGAAQEPREQQEGKEAGAGAAAERRKGAGCAGGGGMKFRVRARAPHGVGALLLIGGAAVVGAAVLAWRRSRHGHGNNKGGGAVDQPAERRMPAKEEALDGGIVEDGKVQAGSLVQKLDQCDEKLSAGNTHVGSDSVDGSVSKESHQIHKEDEITADQLCQDNEHVEEVDHTERIEQNSSTNPVKSIMQEMVNVYLISGSVENVEKDSSKKDIEKDIAQKDDKDMEAPDQSRFCIKGPGIILNKHNDESDGIQEAESMENTPTAQLMMHQDQLLDDDVVTDTVTETEDTVTETEDTIAETEDTVTETEEEAKQGERTVTDKSELKQNEKKDLVGLASSPALSSLVKPILKSEPEFPRPNETGMKIQQDYTNGELREHTDLISKGGAMQGAGDMATMDCRSSALVVIALIFALAMGITIIVRLYAPSRATKLQMDLP